MTLWREDPEPDPGDYLRADKKPEPSKTSTGAETIVPQ